MFYVFVDFDGSKFWYEVGKDGYALRQITINEKNETLISCRQPCLADVVIDTKNDCELISANDFEDIWHKAVKELQPIWKVEKQNYLIGENVSGLVKYFYPQGAIIDLGEIQGCANTDSCIAKSLYPNYKISGTVKGYDERNMWVLIDNCKII